MEYTAASRMCQGVIKSGSPTPREITSFMPRTRSKKARMPEGAICSTIFEILWSMLVRDIQSALITPFLEHLPVFLIFLEKELRGGRADMFHGREFGCDKIRNGLNVIAFDDQQQIVRAGDQITTGHFGKAVHALGDVVETDVLLRGDSHFNERAHTGFS